MSDIINILFDDDNICRVSNKIHYIVILFLSFIVSEGYKIIICHSEDYVHEKEFKLNCNGNIREKIDNLSNVFRQKHILKVPNKPDVSFTTSLRNYRAWNSKYSYFLINKCLDLYSIEHISYEKMSKVIELFTGIKLTRQNIFLHYWQIFQHYAHECMKEIEKEFKKLEIQIGEAVNYDK